VVVGQDGNEYCLHHDSVGRALVNVVDKTAPDIQKLRVAHSVAGKDSVAVVLDILEAEDSMELELDTEVHDKLVVVVDKEKAALGIEVGKKVEVGKLEAAQDRLVEKLLGVPL